MLLLEAVTRLLPGVLGKAESTLEETFSSGLLEYPHYTRPAVFNGLTVPDVLMSGNHEAIRLWRRREALGRTRIRRPELLEQTDLSSGDLKILAEIREETGKK